MAGSLTAAFDKKAVHIVILATRSFFINAGIVIDNFKMVR
jgi:hypothetical protein